MRIAFVIPSLANKGPAIVVKNLVKYLVKKGVYCKVLYFDNIEGLDFDCQTSKIRLTDFDAIKDFDIMHTHGIRPDLYSFLNPSVKINRLSTIHQYIGESFRLNDGYSKIKSTFFEFIWSVFLIRSDRVVVLSRDAELYYRKKLFNKKITYIYNGLDVSFCKALPLDNEISKLKAKGFSIIGSCAYLVYRKGLDQIIEILPHFENLAFVIVGDGPEKIYLARLAEKLGVSDRCLFLGYKVSVEPYLENFDFYAIPSHSEGFPLALIEAISYKKASLVSDIGLFREFFSKEEVSFAKIGDKNSMVKAINRLIKGKEGFEEAAYQKYQSAYTLSIMGKNYYDMYRIILGK
jgi:L-malate glycosyltransferase